jgi:hypothetical protein
VLAEMNRDEVTVPLERQLLKAAFVILTVLLALIALSLYVFLFFFGKLFKSKAV